MGTPDFALDRLPFLPPAPAPRCAAARAWRRAEAVGFAGQGRTVDLAFGARSHFVGRGFARRRAVGTIGQRYRGLSTRQAPRLVDLPSWPMAREIAERVPVTANVAPDGRRCGALPGAFQCVGVTANQARHDLSRHLETGRTRAGHLVVRTAVGGKPPAAFCSSHLPAMAFLRAAEQIRPAM